jgi:hypothetical protein
MEGLTAASGPDVGTMVIPWYKVMYNAPTFWRDALVCGSTLHSNAYHNFKNVDHLMNTKLGNL